MTEAVGEQACLAGMKKESLRAKRGDPVVRCRHRQIL